MTLPIGRRQRLLKNKNSFTLVELLLVVVILGIFVGLAVPSFSKTYLNLEINNTADRIAFMMRYAQAKAVAERQNYRLNFDSENKSCWLEKESSSEPAVFEKVHSKFSKTIIFPKGIKVESEIKIINFSPSGKIDEAEIYLKRDNKTIFTISTKGQIGYVEVSDVKE